jgi:hypothetical protein
MNADEKIICHDAFPIRFDGDLFTLNIEITFFSNLVSSSLNVLMLVDLHFDMECLQTQIVEFRSRGRHF